MNEIWIIALYTAAAGACIPLGASLALFDKLLPGWLENELRHFIIAFGGGVLVAAVALVLVPEGSKLWENSPVAVLLFFAGGMSFFGLERYLAIRKSDAPQTSALLLDYVPEAIALGGTFAAGYGTAPLLALLIGLQNLPEGFNAYRELRASAHSGRYRPWILMLLMVALGPICGIFGWLFLSDHPRTLGAIMLFAAGGIFYLVFQDLAPDAKLQRRWWPALGAVGGFCLGLTGYLLIH